MMIEFHTKGRMATLARAVELAGEHNIVIWIGNNRCYLLKSVHDSKPMAAMDTKATHQMVDTGSLFALLERVLRAMDGANKDYIVSNHRRIMDLFDQKTNKRTVSEIVQAELNNASVDG